MWQVPYDRGEMMRMMEEELKPFVDDFRYGWRAGFTEADVRNAILQCTTLRNFAKTLPNGDAEKRAIDEWLLPRGARMDGEMTMLRYWGHMSPLNLLNFVGLCLRSRYAAMAAWAVAPLLCDYNRPHASTGDVLQAWHAHLDAYGPLRWEEMEAILSNPLPPRFMSIEEISNWIARLRTAPRGEPSLLVWYLYRDYAYYGPPPAPPYAVS